MKRMTFLVTASAFVSLALAAPVWAATFVVTKTADTNDGVCNADCSLREAIVRANAHAGADVIRFATNGIFPVTGNGDNTAATGDLDVSDALEIIGNGRSTTIIDAHGNDRVFDLFAPTTIRQLMVRGGGNESSPSGFGGGILNHSNLSIYDSTLMHNSASGFGGALTNQDDIVDFQRTAVIANTAAFGGGIFNQGDISDGTFANNLFRFNTAAFGGAITTSGDVFTHSFSNNEFTQNSAGFGGAIDNSGDFGPHLATGNLFLQNTADDGGAIANFNAFGFGMTFRHNTFRGNTARDNGGAIFNQVSADFGASGLTFTDNLFEQNAAAVWGGAFVNFGDFGAGPGTVFSRNVFRDNSAVDGGGFYNASDFVDTSFENNAFRENHASDSGGGFYNNGLIADSFFTGNTFDRNVAEDDGGGFYNNDAFTAVFAGNTFSFNRAGDSGGGLFSNESFLGDIVNSTFSGNQALHGDGGGVFNNALQDLDLVHVTFSGNSAGGSGGGIFTQGIEVNLRGVIVANSVHGDDCDSAFGGIFTSLGFNIDTDDTCDLNAVGDQPLTNPLLGPLGSFGGPTMTHLLRRGSHAIDRETAGCPPPATDQRGVTRAQNGDPFPTVGCDVGAVEMRPGEAQP